MPAAEDSHATLSVVITTKDEADLLPDCLESVAWADEIVVVDMFSTDETAEVCARYPQVVFHQRTDYINANLNFGFEQATGDWILRLDTDERVTPELADEIREILRSAPEDVTGYAFWERPVILGRELRHGWGTRHHRRTMFRRGKAHYAVASQHEDFVTSGKWVKGEHGYLHLNYRSVRQYFAKTRYYTDKELEHLGVPAERPSARRALRQTAAVFYLNFLKLRGYRDGWRGLLDASMRAYYHPLLWVKLRRLHARGSASPPPSEGASPGP